MFKNLFHVMTFTSALCALIEAAGDFPKRLSQIAIFPSTEHEANTKGSVGLHCIKKNNNKKIHHFESQMPNKIIIVLQHTCKSSTLSVCPTKGLLSIFHVEPDAGSHKWILFLQSPIK